MSKFCMKQLVRNGGSEIGIIHNNPLKKALLQNQMNVSSERRRNGFWMTFLYAATVNLQ